MTERIDEATRAILRRALEHYGGREQHDKATEEMGELTVALARYRDGRGSAEQVIDELADVAVMIAQLAELYGREAVDERIGHKLARLKRRIAGKRV